VTVPRKPGLVNRVVNLTGPAGREHTLTVEYAFRLPAGKPAGPVPIPLAEAAAATRGSVRVRIWAEPGRVPHLAADGWDEQPLEAVAGQDSLPALCLLARRPEMRLGLRLHEPAEGALGTVAIDRALARVTVGDNGWQTYRVTCVLDRLTADHIDIEFPTAVTRLDPKVWLDGRAVAWEAVDDNGQKADMGRVARLKIGPELVRQAAVLDIDYRLDPGRAAGSGRLQAVLYPPVFRGAIGPTPLRWQVALPPGTLLLAPGGGPGQVWGRRGWLLGPHNATSAADLDRWLLGADDAARPGGDGQPEGLPSFVSRAVEPAPLRVVYVSDRLWLLVCSVTVVAVGLGLYFLPLGRGVVVVALAVLMLAVALAGVLWPAVLGAVLYGCEPGLIVVAMVLGVQWLVHKRYRNRLVFMPGFARVKPGSSLTRTMGSGRPRGEPSTTDAPAEPAPAGGRPSPSSQRTTRPPAEG
jgi:hypothetical protein